MFTDSIVEIDADEARSASAYAPDDYDAAESAEAEPAFIGPHDLCDCPWEDHFTVSLDKPPF